MALSRTLKISGALMGGVAVIALVTWMQRENVARTVIDRELKAQGIDADYDLDGLGTSRQRITNIRLGPKDRPDFTADWAELETGWTLNGPQIRIVHAGSVSLRATLTADGVSFGALDKLLPEKSDEPFSLPDLALSVQKAKVSLTTPYGPVGVALTGRGVPKSSFAGKIAIAAPRLDVEGCEITGLDMSGNMAVAEGVPHFVGPLVARQMRCDSALLSNLNVQADLRSDAQFKTVDGQLGLKSGGLAAPGLARADSGTGSVTLKGGLAEGVSGRFGLDLARLNAAQGRARSGKAEGNFALRRSEKGWSVESRGDVRFAGAQPDADLARIMAGYVAQAAGTPVGPLADSLNAAIKGVQRGTDAQVRFLVQSRDGQGQAVLSGIEARSLSGARLTVAGRDPVRVALPQGDWSVAGSLLLAGGGFPQLSARFSGDQDTLQGTALMAPWRHGGAVLTTSPIRFRTGPRGLSLATIATLDGPLGTGRVEGLSLPLAISNGQPQVNGCHAPSFKALQVEGLRLSPTRLRLCLTGGAVRVEAPRLTGSLGGSPLSLNATGLRYTLADGSFAVDDANINLGSGSEQSALAIMVLSGTLRNGAAQGRFSGLAGSLAAVPLMLSEAAGNWRFAGGALGASGTARISDTNVERRFNPLVSKDFDLIFRNGRVDVSATLQNPARGVDVARVTVKHVVSAGQGEAVLDVPGLTFGEAIQPEELSPITLGVIANVSGSLQGRGLINWDRRGVTSSGSFATKGMDMAAAFGPLTGLAGTIEFSDLLGLVTPPGQQVRLASVNPGMAVLDGLISYQLLPDLKAKIEGGRWPFAGGWLTLEPAILDLNQAAERRLTFKVEGMDAARFIAAMEFENIAATGTFDGVLPMVFDSNGGRIEGGRIDAREGGTLSYNGQISNEKLGPMGRFAFDALKALKYNRLSIDLDGAVDGDVVTRIRFAGINQAPIGGVRASLPIPIKVTGLTNLPFIFNITISAKFRQLFEMARSFNDPSVLINRAIPRLEPIPGQPAQPVQPGERTTQP